MKQWEIFDFPFPSEAQPHPFVIIFPEAIVQSPDYKQVNALICVSVRGDYQLKLRDVRLDRSDGLDWATVVRCHFVFAFNKADARGRRGAVTRQRQRQIVRKLHESFGFAGI